MKIYFYFLKEEIGINTIFYHTFEGGNFLKGIDYAKKPPRSLNTSLPKKFCFELTNQYPAFLSNRIATTHTAMHPQDSGSLF